MGCEWFPGGKWVVGRKDCRLKRAETDMKRCVRTTKPHTHKHTHTLTAISALPQARICVCFGFDCAQNKGDCYTLGNLYGLYFILYIEFIILTARFRRGEMLFQIICIPMVMQIGIESNHIRLWIVHINAFYDCKTRNRICAHIFYPTYKYIRYVIYVCTYCFGFF